MRDLNGGYGLARERVEALRAEAARERFARSFVRPGRPGRASLPGMLGRLLIRTGRALGGDHGTRQQPVPAEAATTVGHVSQNGSAARTPAQRMPARRARSGRHDGLDRLARDLDRLARELTAGEAVEL